MTDAITTVSGKFYAGMTRAEAEEQGVAEKNWFQRVTQKGLIFRVNRPQYMTFDDIDTNHDGVLQDTEICYQRDNEADEKKFKKYGSLITGVIASLAAPALIINPVTAVLVTAGTLGLFCYGLFAKDGSKDREETEKYRQEHLYKAQVA